MRDRAASVVVLAVFVVATAAGVLFLAQRGRSPVAPGARGPLVAAPLYRPRSPARVPFLYGSPIPSPAAAGFVASLASQAGPYTVSVRGLRPAEPEAAATRGLLESGPLGPFYLALEVLAGEGKLRGIHLDNSSLRACDDTGRILQTQPRPDDMKMPFSIPWGRIYFVRMEAPAPGAHALRWIEGSIVTEGTGGRRNDYNFRIEGTPLPSALNLYGRAAPRILDQRAARQLPSGLSVLVGDDALKATAASRPASVHPRFAPQLLLMGSVRPVSINVPTPPDPARLNLHASTSGLGSLRLEIASGAEAWRGEVWDGDPLFVVLPGVADSRRCVALRLTRSAKPPLPPPDPASPFPPEDGQAGGLITFEVSVNGRPFGGGLMTVALRHNISGQRHDTTVMNVPIRADGSVTLANLAPGIYQIERPIAGIRAELPDGQSVPADRYMRERFHADGGAWTGECAEKVQVQAGQSACVSPLRWISRRVTAQPSAWLGR